MKWFYVENGQQAGPVEEDQLPALVQSGKVNRDTLVWHEGMAAWQPFSAVCPPQFAATLGAAPSGAGAPGDSAPEAVCHECHNIFRKEDMIRHKDLYVCANCKPVFMQKLGEGVVTGASRGRRSLPVNPDALIAEIEARGYEVDIGSCVSRGWALVKANFGVCVGATVLVMLCNQAAGFVPFLGIVLSLMLSGPLMAGLDNFFIRLIRGESSGIGDAFSGFSQSFWRLCGAGLLFALCVYAWFLPIGIVVAAVPESSSSFLPLVITLGALGVIGAAYMSVSLIFALPLCIDLELGAWDSLRVSRRIVSKHWFAVFGLVFVAGLLSVLGVLACIVGVFFTMPILYAVTMQAYEDIFGAKG